MIHSIKKQWYIIALIILSSCAATRPKLALKKDVPISSLGINLMVNPEIAPFISNQLQKQLDDFILLYNSENHPLKIDRMEDCDSYCLQIKVHAVQLVSAEKQTTGVVVSLLGLSMPFIMASAKSPIVFAFWYFPKTASLSEISLSNDIDASVYKSTRHVLYSPGFLKSPEKQVIRHGQYFNNYLRSIMRELTSSIKQRN